MSERVSEGVSEWSGAEWSAEVSGVGGVEWSGVEWSGVEWSGVEWSGVAHSRPALRFGPLLQHSLARVTCPRRTFHPGLCSRSAAGDLHHLHAPLLCDRWRSPSPSCTAAGGCLEPLPTSATSTRVQ